MVIFFIILLILSVYRIHFKDYNHDYLGWEESTIVKGIFVIVVFLAHASGYITLSDSFGDILFNKVVFAIGQTMVVMFFFYSGYGVLESYRQRTDYDKTFFKRRFLRTLIHFDLALVLYMILNLILGIKRSIKVILMSLVGLASIGNSNWFIFVILMLYLLTLLSFCLNRREHNFRSAALVTTALCLLLWAAMHVAGCYETWYNTLLCYPAGMLFSAYKNDIDKFMSQNRNYWIVVAVLIVSVCLCWLFRGGPAVYSTFSLTVCLLIVAVTMKVKIDNKYLYILGKHSFSMFILQRLPMTVLRLTGISDPIIFTCLAFVLTFVLAYWFDQLLKTVDSAVLRI